MAWNVRYDYASGARTIGTAEGPAKRMYSGKRNLTAKSLPTCRVCGGHNVMLYADFDFEQIGRDGTKVIAFCVPCSQHAFNSWDPSDRDLYDTVDRFVERRDRKGNVRIVRTV